MESDSLQKQAKDYVKMHNIDLLLKEALHSAISNKEINSHPVVNMINYFSQMVPAQELEKAGIVIKEKKASVISAPLIKSFNFPENSSLIIKRFLSSNVYEKLKGVKTSLGGHISHIIDAALKVDNKETVGIFATDEECYKAMSILFKPALEFLHSYDNEKSLLNYSNPFGLETGFDWKEKFVALRLKLSRNLNGFPYLPHAQVHTRKAIKDKLVEALKVVYQHGEFYEIGNVEFDTLKDIFFDKELNLISAGRKH